MPEVLDCGGAAKEELPTAVDADRQVATRTGASIGAAIQRPGI